ncbi:uncharacterized protein BDV17DRAFT_253095 [Aspergillus undulatus]|uniref:uncharacterized protein n=1 Tax=Aspergillus undulatus TaxID=1810928 RepID=UPI003CCCD317
MSVIHSILECLFGALEIKPDFVDATTTVQSNEHIASDIVTKILNADDAYALHKELGDLISTTNWKESLAKATLRGLEKAIASGANMARAASDALAQAENAAIGFATEHPVYATLIALGILAILTPFVLEMLGFGELGPIDGSFAAWWQSTYEGYVPKRALFGYFQRLGMKWHWF